MLCWWLIFYVRCTYPRNLFKWEEREDFFAAIAGGCSQAESDMWANGRGWLAYSSFLKHINLFLIHAFDIKKTECISKLTTHFCMSPPLCKTMPYVYLVFKALLREYVMRLNFPGMVGGPDPHDIFPQESRIMIR